MANSKWPVDENGFPANSQTFPIKYSQGAGETTNNLLFVKTSNGNETKAAKVTSCMEEMSKKGTGER